MRLMSGTAAYAATTGALRKIAQQGVSNLLLPTLASKRLRARAAGVSAPSRLVAKTSFAVYRMSLRTCTATRGCVGMLGTEVAAC